MPGNSKIQKITARKNCRLLGLVLLATMLVLTGVIAATDRELQISKGIPALEGSLAVMIGLVLIIFGSYILYRLLARAYQEEDSRSEFHELENFEQEIDGYNSTFEIVNSRVACGRNRIIPVFYYNLKVEFTQNLYLNLNLERRDKFEFFLWKIRIKRKWDVSTKNDYIDSRYRVQCSNKNLFFRVFTKKVIQLLEKFDRDIPPISNQKGALIITDTQIKYMEGPYNEELRIFDPPRGKLEDIFKKLASIISSIENNLPESINESDKNEIIKIKNEIQERKKSSMRIKDTFLSIYTTILFILVSGGILISLFCKFFR